jgi:molybdopterin converting factor small subunit
MEINVLFFGVLAEVTKTAARHYSNIVSFDELRLRIEDEFPELVHYDYRIVVNNELAEGTPAIKSDDEISFLPPFAGG